MSAAAVWSEAVSSGMTVVCQGWVMFARFEHICDPLVPSGQALENPVLSVGENAVCLLLS